MGKRSEMSDQKLINEIVKSNRDAKRVLLGKYFPQVYDYAARTSRDIVKGEEVLTQAFRQIFDRISAGIEIKDFKILAFQTIYALSRENRVSKVVGVRKPLNFNAEPEFLQADPRQTSQPALLLHDSEIVELTWWIASNIDPAQYSALDLRYRQNFTSEEIGAVVGIRTSDVDVLLDRAEEFLNENLLTILVIGRDLGIDAGLQALSKVERNQETYYIPRSTVRNYVMRSRECQKMRYKYPVALEVFASLANCRPSFGGQSKITNYLLNVDAIEPEDTGDGDVKAYNVNDGLTNDTADINIPKKTIVDNIQCFINRVIYSGSKRLVSILGLIGIISLVILVLLLTFDSDATDETVGFVTKVDGPITVNEETSSAVDLMEFDDVKFTSISHMIGNPSEIMRITIRWDYISGPEGGSDNYLQDKIRGYSFYWDSNVDTLPDRIIDIDQTVVEVISPALSFGQWWFHIRTVDVDGHWSTPMHSGPYVLEKFTRSTLENPDELSAKIQQNHITDLASDSTTSASVLPIQGVTNMVSHDMVTQILDENGLPKTINAVVEIKIGDYAIPSKISELAEPDIDPPVYDKQPDNLSDSIVFQAQSPEQQPETVVAGILQAESNGEKVVELNGELVMVEATIDPQSFLDQSISEIISDPPFSLEEFLDMIVPIKTAGRNSEFLPPIPAFFSGSASLSELIDPEGAQIIATIGEYSSNFVPLTDYSYKLLIIDPLSNDFYGKEISFWLISDDKIFKAGNHAFFEEANLSKGSTSIFRTLNLQFGY